MIGLACAPEQHDSVLSNQVLDEVPLLLLEEMPAFVGEVREFRQLLTVVLELLVLRTSVDHEDSSFLYIYECPKGLEETAQQLRQLVCSCLRNVAFVDHQKKLRTLVDIQQPLNEEGVADLELLPFVVLESGTVEVGSTVNHELRWHASLRIAVMADLQPLGILGV